VTPINNGGIISIQKSTQTPSFAHVNLGLLMHLAQLYSLRCVMLLFLKSQAELDHFACFITQVDQFWVVQYSISIRVTKTISEESLSGTDRISLSTVN